MEELFQAVEDGSFLGTESTATRYRDEAWFPQIFSQSSKSDFVAETYKTSETIAKEKIKAIFQSPDDEPLLDGAEEELLWKAATAEE